MEWKLLQSEEGRNLPGCHYTTFVFQVFSCDCGPCIFKVFPVVNLLASSIIILVSIFVTEQIAQRYIYGSIFVFLKFSPLLHLPVLDSQISCP